MAQLGLGLEVIIPKVRGIERERERERERDGIETLKQLARRTTICDRGPG